MSAVFDSFPAAPVEATTISPYVRTILEEHRRERAVLREGRFSPVQMGDIALLREDLRRTVGGALDVEVQFAAAAILRGDDPPPGVDRRLAENAARLLSVALDLG